MLSRLRALSRYVCLYVVVTAMLCVCVFFFLASMKEDTLVHGGSPIAELKSLFKSKGAAALPQVSSSSSSSVHKTKK